MVSYTLFLLNALYHVKVHMKTRESRLQNRNLIYKMGFLEYKRDSRVAIYLLFTFRTELNYTCIDNEYIMNYN